MTIVPIGKVIVQAPKGKESGYRAKLNQQIQGMVQKVVGQCVEGLLFEEVDRQLQRKRHQRRARMWGEMYSAMKCNKCGSQRRNDFRRNGSYEPGVDSS